MFTVFDIGPWVIEADAAETRKQYEKPWDDRCDCANCRNFSEAMNLLPAEKTRLFTQFGIRPSVTTWGRSERKAAGIIMRAVIRLSAALAKAGRSLILRRREISAFRFLCRFFIPKDFSDPIIHLNFSLLLPWVLEEDAD
nr:hypothetical protein [Bacillus amyloliquefaciens]